MHEDVIWIIEKWYETHTVMTKENYEMCKEIVNKFREKEGKSEEK